MSGRTSIVEGGCTTPAPTSVPPSHPLAFVPKVIDAITHIFGGRGNARPTPPPYRGPSAAELRRQQAEQREHMQKLVDAMHKNQADASKREDQRAAAHERLVRQLMDAQAQAQARMDAQMHMLLEKLFAKGVTPAPKAVPLATKEEVQRRFGMDTDRHYHWAVTGSSGAGKSTLIGTLMGKVYKKGANNGAPKTGPTEATMTRTVYEIPRLPQARVHDLPGAGTKRFPLGTYAVDQRLDVFDAVLIVVHNRVTEADHVILAACEKAGVPALIIRSKFDYDLRNLMEDDDRKLEDASPLEVTDLMNELRNDVVKQFGARFADSIFVMSNKLRHVTRYDFPRFMMRLLQATHDQRGRPEGGATGSASGMHAAGTGAGAGGAGAGAGGAGAGARASTVAGS